MIQFWLGLTKSLFHLKVSCIIHTWFSSDFKCLFHLKVSYYSSLTWTHQDSVSFEGFMLYSYMIQFWLGLTKSLFHSKVSCIIHTWFNSDLDLPSLCFIRRFHALFIYDSILTWTYQVSVSYYSVLTWTHQVSVTKSLFHLKVSCVIHTFVMHY